MGGRRGGKRGKTVEGDNEVRGSLVVRGKLQVKRRQIKKHDRDFNNLIYDEEWGGSNLKG
jgi:hypothetical protein